MKSNNPGLYWLQDARGQSSGTAVGATEQLAAPWHHQSAWQGSGVASIWSNGRDCGALLSQAAMTPFVGAAGKTVNRISLATIGTVVWGITNVGIGLASTFRQVILVLSRAAALYVVPPPM